MQSHGAVALLIAIATMLSGASAGKPEVYVRVTFKMTWARFCYLDDLFKDRFAELLFDKKGMVTKPSQIIIMEFEKECSTHLKRRGNDRQAKVDFYITKPGGEKDGIDTTMTNKAFYVLYYLMETSNMLQVDKVFVSKVEKVQSLGEMAQKPPSAYTETQKTWIGVGVGLGATAVIVLIYLFVVARRNEKEIRERIRVYYSRNHETNEAAETPTEQEQPQQSEKVKPTAFVEVHGEGNSEEKKETAIDEKL